MNIDPKMLNDLTPQAKKWFARAVAGIIAADGVIDEREIDFLKLTLTFLKNENEVNEIVDLVKQKKLPILPQLRDINRPVAFTMLVLITKLAIYDFHFSKTEGEYVKQVATKLGFNKNFQNIFLTWASDTAALNKKMEDLKRMAFQSQPEYF
jgi:hypothetical protein